MVLLLSDKTCSSHTGAVPQCVSVYMCVYVRVRANDCSHTELYFCHIGEEEDKEVI
jgi:hypothetical protein